VDCGWASVSKWDASLNLENVQQAKDIPAHFSDVWQGKELGGIFVSMATAEVSGDERRFHELV
jgi:hypothetical protein